MLSTLPALEIRARVTMQESRRFIFILDRSVTAAMGGVSYSQCRKHKRPLIVSL